MKKTLLILALATTLGGCTSLQNAGEGLCTTQVEISEGISDLGAFAGPPGMVVARVINLGLSTFCKVIAGVAAMPADVTGDVTGMFTSDPTPEAIAAEEPGR